MRPIWTERHRMVLRGRPRRRVPLARGRSWTMPRIGLRSGFGQLGGIRSTVPYPHPGFPHRGRSRLAGQHHQYGFMTRRFLGSHRIRGLSEDVRDLARVLGVDLTGGQRTPRHRHHCRRLLDARPRFLPGDPQRPHQHRLSTAETLSCSQIALLYLPDHRQHPRIRTTQLPFRGMKFSGQFFVGKPPFQHLLCVIHIATIPRTGVRRITQSGRTCPPVNCAEILEWQQKCGPGRQGRGVSRVVPRPPSGPPRPVTG